MGLLSREKLLTKEVLKIEKVKLSKDEFVYVKEMTGHEREMFENSLMKEIRDDEGKLVKMEQDRNDFRAKLAVMTLCDEQGGLLLKPEDYQALSESMSAAKLTKIADAATSLSKISEEDKEELIKNLEAVRDGNSSLDSAGN